MDTLADRVSWAIVKILDKMPISDQALSKILGTNKNTIAAYRDKKGLIKGSVLEGLVGTFHFSAVWLLQGVGEPLPDERIKRHSASGLEPAEPSQPQHHIMEERAEFDAPSPSGAIGEDVALAIQVLQSKTPYATALHLNIRSFADAVADKEKIASIEQSYARIESENARMQIQLANLQAAVEKLMKKMPNMANIKGK